MATQLPPNATQNDVEEEIEFHEILIASLDSGADDYAERLSELENNKTELERRLDALLSTGLHSQPTPDPNEGSMDSHDERPAWWQLPPTEDSMGSEGHDGMPLDGDPFMTPYSGLKRPLPESLRLESRQASKRATPEPSHVATPASSVESFGIYDSTGTEVHERARRRQLAAEAALKRNQESKIADEQYARSLSQLQTQPRANGFASSSSQLPTFQTTLSYDGSYKPPPLSNAKPTEHTSIRPPPVANGHHSHLPPNAPSRSFGEQARSPYVKTEQNPYQHIKAEPSSSTSYQRSHPRGQPVVVDLTGSDSDGEDLSEIAPDGFTPSERSQKPNLTSPLALRTTQAAIPVQRPMPGAFPPPLETENPLLPSSWMTPAQNGYQPVYGNPARAYQVQPGMPQQGNPFVNTAMNGVRNVAGAVGNSLTHMGNHLTTSLWPGPGGPYSSHRQPRAGSGNDDLLVLGSQPLLGSSRPYAGYDDRDLYNRRYNEIADHNPEKTKEEIGALLENIRPDENIPADLRVKTPEAMTIKLHKYQEMGLDLAQTV